MQQKKEHMMQRQFVIPFPSEAIDSTLITAQIDNLLLIKELPAQSCNIKTSSDINHG